MLGNDSDADKTIFVGNLDSSVKEEILFELFLQAGPLRKVTIAVDSEGHQRSYGFVCYKHAEAVPYAIALLNGTWLYGRPIKLQHKFGSSFQDGDIGPPYKKDGLAQDNSSVTANAPLVCHVTEPPDVRFPPHGLQSWSSMRRGLLPSSAPPLLPPPLLQWPGPGFPSWTAFPVSLPSLVQGEMRAVAPSSPAPEPQGNARQGAKENRHGKRKRSRGERKHKHRSRR